jgi:hypothetical protein
VNPVGWFLVVLFLGGGILFWITIPEIGIGQIWVAVSLLLVVIYSVVGRRAKAARRLRQEGIPGRATILEMTQTGTYVNEQPMVKFRLRIEATGVPAYEVEERMVVPLIALGTLTSGQPLTVYIDREDHKRFTIDWGGGLGAPAMTVSSQGGTPVNLASNPAAVQEISKILEQRGIEAAGEIDLRQDPAARQEVLDALRRHGVDAAHEAAAAAPTLPVAPPAPDEPPLERLTKLMQLKGAQLISDEEFEAQRKRIIESI